MSFPIPCSGPMERRGSLLSNPFSSILPPSFPRRRRPFPFLSSSFIKTNDRPSPSFLYGMYNTAAAVAVLWPRYERLLYHCCIHFFTLSELFSGKCAVQRSEVLTCKKKRGKYKFFILYSNAFAKVQVGGVSCFFRRSNIAWCFFLFSKNEHVRGGRVCVCNITAKNTRLPGENWTSIKKKKSFFLHMRESVGCCSVIDTSPYK